MHQYDGKEIEIDISVLKRKRIVELQNKIILRTITNEEMDELKLLVS